VCSSDLAINSANSNVGLIRILFNGKVQNLGLINVTINGRDNVGGLIGLKSGSVTVSTGSYVSGTVNGSDSVGGLIGYNQGGSINNCYVKIEVTGTNSVGGLIGKNSGSVARSYATGNVTGVSSNVGGLIGNKIAGSVNYSYATCTVRGTNYVGGLIGRNTGSIINSYWYDVPNDNATQCYSGGDTNCTVKTDISYFKGDVNTSLGPFNQWTFDGNPWYKWTAPADYPNLYAQPPIGPSEKSVPEIGNRSIAVMIAVVAIAVILGVVLFKKR
jgi:hypothetical protein